MRKRRGNKQHFGYGTRQSGNTINTSHKIGISDSNLSSITSPRTIVSFILSNYHRGRPRRRCGYPRQVLLAGASHFGSFPNKPLTLDHQIPKGCQAGISFVIFGRILEKAASFGYLCDLPTKKAVPIQASSQAGTPSGFLPRLVKFSPPFPVIAGIRPPNWDRATTISPSPESIMVKRFVQFVFSGLPLIWGCVQEGPERI